MKNIILSAFADEYSSSFDEQLALLKNNSFGYIETRFIDGENISVLNDEKLKVVKTKLHDAGIKVSSVGSPLGKINLKDDFNEHLEKTRRTCYIARELDCDRIRMFSFYLPEGMTREDCKQQVHENLSKMLDIADEYGVKLCHENEAKIYGESPDKCLELMETFKGRLRCVLDMGNFVLDGYDPKEAYNMLYPYIEYFHIKDAMSEGAIVPAGKGEAKIREILEDYTNKGNTALISLEPHLQTFDGLNALVGKSFDNPYKFKDQKDAFIHAIASLRETLSL